MWRRAHRPSRRSEARRNPPRPPIPSHPATVESSSFHPTLSPLSFRRSAQRQGGICCPSPKKKPPQSNVHPRLVRQVRPAPKAEVRPPPAAKRRKNAAHSASCLVAAGMLLQPRRGERNARIIYSTSGNQESYYPENSHRHINIIPNFQQSIHQIRPNNLLHSTH